MRLQLFVWIYRYNLNLNFGGKQIFREMLIITVGVFSKMVLCSTQNENHIILQSYHLYFILNSSG
jgi:hypothetical protein